MNLKYTQTHSLTITPITRSAQYYSTRKHFTCTLGSDIDSSERVSDIITIIVAQKITRHLCDCDKSSPTCVHVIEGLE